MSHFRFHRKLLLYIYKL